MCTYCMMGDHVFRFDQPWPVPRVHPSYPLIPQQVPPPTNPPWSIERLKEYLDLLKQVKAMEDQIGCPCEPNKADYIGMFKKRIEALEKKVAKRKTGARS